ncbi:ABC transporter permease [Paucisalibacillus globulus]|uniref:ABC transporter permease n=1 Tax=Paucisalibacillus globulus TaxID=351095 RepID=UPI0004100C59|nr:ABC transporter permease [Paucisalibacillus globulus]
MGSFIKKDLLVFWRDRKEVLLSLLLPIVLIAVLNIALSGLFNSDEDSINIHVGIVEEDNSSIGMEQFEEALNQLNISQVEQEAALKQAQMLDPSKTVRDFFNNPELQDWLHTQNISETEAIKLVEEGELDAFVKIPEGFTYEVLSSIIFDEEADVGLTIHADEQSTELTTLQNMVNNFVDSVNLQFALGTSAGTDSLEQLLPQGGSEIMEGVEMYSFSQYITIAMSALFSLFIAQTVAMKTVTEKRERVFNRIILADSHPLQFLIGKTFATFCLSLLQITLTFTVSQLLFDIFPDKSMQFWLGILIIFTLFALSIAGLSALFTSISLNLRDENAISGIFTAIIMGMAVLGGSFAPIQSLPAVLQKIGEWTPNGLTQTVLLEWIQFTNPSDLIIPIIVLIGFFIVCLAIGMSIFPTRGRN